MWVALLHDPVYPFSHSVFVCQHLDIHNPIYDALSSSSTKSDQRWYACDTVLGAYVCYSSVGFVTRVEFCFGKGDTGELVYRRWGALTNKRYEEWRYGAAWSTGGSCKEDQQ